MSWCCTQCNKKKHIKSSFYTTHDHILQPCVDCRRINSYKEKKIKKELPPPQGMFRCSCGQLMSIGKQCH